MAITETDIREVAAKFAVPANAAHGTQAVREAGRATDEWIDNNQASYNDALPEPFKSDANATQKTLLFCYVALRRAGLI